jgi:hypothetical protein
MKTIYLGDSRGNRAKKWFIAASPSRCDGDRPGGAVPDASTVPAHEVATTSSPDQPHRPWLVPGVGKL